MTVKIYGVDYYICTQRVCVVLKELGVAYEIIPVNVAAGELKSNEYIMNKQPFGQVPVLEDEDGFKLFESRAICRYLVDKYGKGELIPKDLKKKALFEQAVSIEQANFDPYAAEIATEKVIKPIQGIQGDDRRVEELQRILEAKLLGYEIMLSKQKYLAGNELTLADLFHLPFGWLITKKAGIRAFESDKFPNVKRWWADISSRESWKAVQADLDGR